MPIVTRLLLNLGFSYTYKCTHNIYTNQYLLQYLSINSKNIHSPSKQGNIFIYLFFFFQVSFFFFLLYKLEILFFFNLDRHLKNYYYNYYFYFTILYWFCHTSTCICHGCTHVPHPEPPSRIPPHTIPLGHPSAPAPGFLYPASNLDWRFVSYMILYMLNSILPNHPPPSHRVQKTVLYICVSFAVLHTGLSLPTF